MPDEPGGPDLLDAVARLLRDELLPLLPPAAAFNARVAANAVDLVARELRSGAAADAAAAARLRALLQREAGNSRDLESELCQRLKNGDIDPADPTLRSHLWATTLDKLAIDQPAYAPYRRELQRRQE